MAKRLSRRNPGETSSCDTHGVNYLLKKHATCPYCERDRLMAEEQRQAALDAEEARTKPKKALSRSQATAGVKIA